MIHARAAAAFFTLLLFSVGSLPAAGQVFPGVSHWIAHLVTYALIAFAFAHGWPMRPAIQIFVFVSVIGAVHEASEIYTHNHGIEWEDVMINAAGAFLGLAAQLGIRRWQSKSG